MSRPVFAAVNVTGPLPGIHHVWEIGLLEQRETGRVRHHFFPKPGSLSNADPGLLNEARFHERTYGWSEPTRDLRLGQDAPVDPTWHNPYLVALRIGRVLAGATLVGFDAGRTAAFLDRYVRSLDLAPSWSRDVVDVDVLHRGFELGRGYPAVNDAALTETALDVADEAARVYDAMHVGVPADAQAVPL